MRRKALIGAAIVALLFALYAAAGTWLAPRFVRDALLEQARRAGLELQLEEVRTDPFGANVELLGVQLRAPGGRTLATARSASADIAWASLWRPAWIVQHAAVHEPVVDLVLGPRGELLWPSANPAPQEARTGSKAAFSVQKLDVTQGTLRVMDRSRGAPVAVELRDVGLQASGVSTLQNERGQYALSARLAAGGMLSSEGRVSLQPLSAGGTLTLAAVPLSELWQLAAPRAEEAARGQVHARAAYRYEDERLVLQNVSIEGAGVSYAGVTLPQVRLETPELAVPPQAPFELTAQASVQPSGTLSAAGTLDPGAAAADFKVEIGGLALAQAQAWLPEGAAIDIASGLLSARGRLRVQPEGEGPAAVYEGALAVRELRLDERGSGKRLLGWRAAESADVKLDFAPYGVAIGTVSVRSPEGRLIIEEDGAVNVAQVFGAGTDKAQKGEVFHATVSRLLVEDGTLEFADLSLEPAFGATLRELAGSVIGLSTKPHEPAQVQLAGRVEKYGSVRVRGTIDLDAPTSLATITANFRNLPLAELTPYAVKFAGYRIRSGRLSAELRYEVRDGRVQGRNDLAFERLQLGEKVESASALDLPLELAVALLADAKGRINLDIPVSGNLKDPQFDLGGLIAKAIRNVIGKIVSAPFRALASLVGGGARELDEVRFAAGSSALSPPEEESIAQVAKALGERPRLGVSVRAGFDPESDPEALRRRAVQREIARRAGCEGENGPLPFSDPKVLHAAENLYLDRVGNRLELNQLRAKTQDYGSALVEQLAAAAPLDAASAEALARARAEEVRAALLEHGVDPERVRLEAPAPAQAGKEGVATQLALLANLPAQAEADVQEDAPYAEAAVRALQRKLKAAGFDAGPIDGRWGPLTQSALRNYQEAKGLEHTGRLDGATRAALGLSEAASAGATAQ